MSLCNLLPLDIRRLVLFHLPLSFSYSPIECCEQYFTLLTVSPTDSVVWKSFFKRDFGDEVSGVTDYKQEYIKVLHKVNISRLSYAKVHELDILLTNSLLLTSVKSNNMGRLNYALSDPDVDINTRDNDGNTSLHYAARLAEIKLVKVLVNDGIDVNSRNRYGDTALHITPIYNKTFRISKYLIKHGADIHIANNRGHTFTTMVGPELLRRFSSSNF